MVKQFEMVKFRSNCSKVLFPKKWRQFFFVFFGKLLLHVKKNFLRSNLISEKVLHANFFRKIRFFFVFEILFVCFLSNVKIDMLLFREKVAKWHYIVTKIVDI
jgi:hypothetical protein